MDEEREGMTICNSYICYYFSRAFLLLGIYSWNNMHVFLFFLFLLRFLVLFLFLLFSYSKELAPPTRVLQLFLSHVSSSVTTSPFCCYHSCHPFTILGINVMCESPPLVSGPCIFLWLFFLVFHFYKAILYAHLLHPLTPGSDVNLLYNQCSKDECCQCCLLQLETL